MARAPVNKLIPHSVVDGPGSRTAVFLQGCNLRCAYCHNPETQTLCNSCGACVPACPAGALEARDGQVVWNREICTGCDACIAACPRFSSPKAAQMEAAEVFAWVERNIPFIRGITVSGGECMLYPGFLLELAGLCKSAGLGFLLDSNGAVDFSLYPDLLQCCDGVMLDIKSWDDGVHRALTGEGSGIPRRNLRLLAEWGKLAELRMVHVPGHTDTAASIEGAAAALGGHVDETRLKLIRFRPYGVRGALAGMPSPGDGAMAILAALARENGFRDILVV